MKILGLSLDGPTLYGVVLESTRAGAEIVSFHKRSRLGPAEMIAQVVEESGVRDVAWALAPPDCLLFPLPNAEHLSGSQRKAAATLTAAAQGFKAADRVTLVTLGKTAFVAAARRDKIGEVESLVSAGHGKVERIDHMAYAWASVMPEDVQALVIASESDVMLVVANATRAEFARFMYHEFASSSEAGSAERAVADRISETLLDASKSGFVDVERVAVYDPTGAFGRILNDRMRSGRVMVPFELEADPEHTPWALACGTAFRAVAADDRIALNFVDKTRSAGDEQIRKLLSRVSGGDAGVVAAAALICIGLVAWRDVSISQLDTRARVYQERLIAAKADATVLQQESERVARARAIVGAVEGAHRSGPVTARQVAALCDRMGTRLTASSLAITPQGTLSGHAAAYDDVGALVRALADSGYQPALQTTQQQTGRLAFTVALGSRSTP